MGHTITPEHITRLAPNEVFVFGSNAKGRHLGGAACTAWLKFGAKFGKGTGHHGQSYAIDSMSGLPTLEHQAQEFIDYATEHQELTFLLTPIGTGIAGLTAEQVAPLSQCTTQHHPARIFRKHHQLNHPVSGDIPPLRRAHLARETRITLIDDIDGTEATESINFTINANSYEIDLNDTNAAAFRAAFQPYIDSAQHNTQQATTDSQAIREWAAKNNIQVNARGRIKQEIIDQYYNSLRKQAAGRN